MDKGGESSEEKEEKEGESPRWPLEGLVVGGEGMRMDKPSSVCETPRTQVISELEGA